MTNQIPQLCSSVFNPTNLLFHCEFTSNLLWICDGQQGLLMFLPVAQYRQLFSTVPAVNHLHCCRKRLEMQQFSSYLQYIHDMTRAWFSGHISTVLYLSNVSITGESSGVHLSSHWPCIREHGTSMNVVLPASSSSSFLPPVGVSYICQPHSHRAETLTMLAPAELVVVWMLKGGGWLGGRGGLRCGGPWSPSPSGVKAGGVGRLMMAVVIRPLLQLILLLSSVLRLRLERLLSIIKCG